MGEGMQAVSHGAMNNGHRCDCEERSLNSYNFCQIKKIVFGNTVYETINRCSKGDSK